jgi:hypothetical protein
MSIFKLQAVSLPDGKFASAWFDDERLLWDDERLHKAEPILATRSTPRLKLLEPRPTPVLFNPNAFAVSARVRSDSGSYLRDRVSPVEIDGFEAYFIMHVVAAVAAPERCSLRRSPIIARTSLNCLASRRTTLHRQCGATMPTTV